MSIERNRRAGDERRGAGGGISGWGRGSSAGAGGVRCVAVGMSTAQIAEQLVVSPSTVRKHLENAFGRLGVSSRTAAVARVFPEPEAL
ncbi:helix-turn-helix transcriptional regulator [Streptomyces sp. SAI-149]|uniref:response regulator transcription factor n=1 Tax=unclassified Streptomyces TaxID=2593676 RepID=UPI0032AF0E25